MQFPRPNFPSAKRRVVITGAGIVTCLGSGWEANAEGFREGRRGFRPVTLFDVSRQRVKIAGEADVPETIDGTRLKPRDFRRIDRASGLLLQAAREAWHQARWEPDESLPIVLGTTAGGMSLGESYYRQSISPGANHRGQATRVINYQAQKQGLDLQEAFGFLGPITIIANACASGANAVGHAWELIRNGHSERALAGGYDALCQMTFAGFDALQALSTTECRPFDAQRDGLALGEGAGVLMLETLESAERRGAEILGEIAGYGAATDIHHLTQPHPGGAAALASMTRACEAAGIVASEVGYINAHGTGTPFNDASEMAAIKAWAGEHVGKVAVSSTKASVGHLLGAAGAVEVIVCLMALRGQWLPPMTNLRQADAGVAFPLVREKQDAPLEYALTNSFGFGGANATVALRRWS